MLEVRTALGYGGRKRAAFARQLGITPPSLSDLESGESKEPSVKTLEGLKAKGGNPDYVLYGKGPMLLKLDPEKVALDKQTIAMLNELPEEEQAQVRSLIKTLRRRHPGSSPTDPFKFDPPKTDDSNE